MTVLVVDDDPQVRRYIVRCLAGLGLDSVEASDGVEGLAALGRRSFDLVISDVAMPRMGGLDLLAELAASGSPPPTLLISGQWTEANEERARALGATTLAKPVGVDELDATVRRLVGRSA